ncbi:MAG: Rrf2 family transcriptional regulator [Rhodospirillales bacterium]|nr:Rrf2 family transcriptional regulator [Rhodospirillales bacterium]
MHLTKYSDYALRTLIYLAVKDTVPATIQEIAGKYGISRNHLVKVVHQLSIAGLIHTERGRGGGIRLGKPASEINIGTVVRLTEEDLDLAECFNGSKNQCLISGNCRLQGALNQALSAFMAELDRYTVADFTTADTGLAQLFASPTG